MEILTARSVARPRLLAAVDFFRYPFELRVVGIFVNGELEVVGVVVVVAKTISIVLIEEVPSILALVVEAVDLTVLIAGIYWRLLESQRVNQLLVRVLDLIEAVLIHDALV